jgi:hypothetical protein
MKHTIRHVPNTVSFTAIMGDDYYFIPALYQTLAQLVDVHFYSTQAGEEEITNHRDYRFR